MYNLSNVVVTGFDLGNDSDTASTGTGADSFNSIQEFAHARVNTNNKFYLVFEAQDCGMVVFSL